MVTSIDFENWNTALRTTFYTLLRHPKFIQPLLLLRIILSLPFGACHALVAFFMACRADRREARGAVDRSWRVRRASVYLGAIRCLAISQVSRMLLDVRDKYSLKDSMKFIGSQEMLEFGNCNRCVAHCLVTNAYQRKYLGLNKEAMKAGGAVLMSTCKALR
jgi:hypothetical protein